MRTMAMRKKLEKKRFKFPHRKHPPRRNKFPLLQCDFNEQAQLDLSIGADGNCYFPNNSNVEWKSDFPLADCSVSTQRSVINNAMLVITSEQNKSQTISIETFTENKKNQKYSLHSPSWVRAVTYPLCRTCFNRISAFRNVA